MKAADRSSRTGCDMRKQPLPETVCGALAEPARAQAFELMQFVSCPRIPVPEFPSAAPRLERQAHLNAPVKPAEDAAHFKASFKRRERC